MIEKVWKDLAAKSSLYPGIVHSIIDQESDCMYHALTINGNTAINVMSMTEHRTLKDEPDAMATMNLLKFLGVEVAE